MSRPANPYDNASCESTPALMKFGAPLENDGIIEETFNGHQVVYQIGVAPVRIDVLTELSFKMKTSADKFNHPFLGVEE